MKFASATFVTPTSLDLTSVSGSVSWSAEFPASPSPKLTSFSLQGDYNNYECGLTVASARAEDNGDWECDFESYVKVGEVFFWNEPIHLENV